MLTVTRMAGNHRSMRTSPVRGVRSELSTRIAAEVRAEMGRQGISSAALARKLGVSEAWTSRRLSINGDQTMDLDDLPRIADVLGVPIAELLPREVGRPNDRSAPGRPAPHAVDVRSPNVAGTRRRPKARQHADSRLIAA